MKRNLGSNTVTTASRGRSHALPSSSVADPREGDWALQVDTTTPPEQETANPSGLSVCKALPASPLSSVLCIKQWSSLLFWAGTCLGLCPRLLASDCNSLLFLNKLMFAGKITGRSKVNTIMESADFHMRNRIFFITNYISFPRLF